MERTTTPEHYIQMLSRFREGIDITEDPFNAFISGTPRWMMDEWVDFNTCTVEI
jgi:hypothetical protein